MKKIFKGIVASSLSMVILIATSISVFAAHYDRVSGSAGSINVNCEVGFDGGRAYAYVSASDYVGAYMDGEAYYYDGITKVLYGGFDQRTYGEVVTRRSDCDVAVASCDFTVWSDEGEYNHYCYAN